MTRFILFCFLTSTSFLFAQTCDCLEIPKATSINHEQTWQVDASKCQKDGSFVFRVFNRWGNSMLEVKDWEALQKIDFFQNKDGKRLIGAGTYFWSFEYKRKGQKDACTTSGFIQLID